MNRFSVWIHNLRVDYGLYFRFLELVLIFFYVAVAVAYDGTKQFVTLSIMIGSYIVAVCFFP